MSINNYNKVVVITGLSKGIGKSIAEEFIKSGHYVIINSDNEESLEEVVDDITHSTSNKNMISYLAGDISDQSFSEFFMDEVMKKFGRIDVLINNAKATNKPNGSSVPRINSQNDLQSQLHYFLPEEYETIDPKIKGIYYSIKAAVRKMLVKNNPNCSIINISSCQGCLTEKAADSYAQCNSGVDPYMNSMSIIETTTRTLALELADQGIRVNGIIPGLVLDDLNEELEDDEYKRSFKEAEIPLKRIAKPEEISKVALFLASDDASYITGAVIHVDGGLNLSRPSYFVEVK